MALKYENAIKREPGRVTASLLSQSVSGSSTGHAQIISLDDLRPRAEGLPVARAIGDYTKAQFQAGPTKESGKRGMSAVGESHPADDCGDLGGNALRSTWDRKRQ